MEKSRRNMFGSSTETKRFWILSGFIFIWFTSAFDNMVFANVDLEKNQKTFELWFNSPPKSQYKVSIFNYTNVQEFESGNATKLKVKELGPYVYEMFLKKINTTSINSSVTYREQTHLNFLPVISKGFQSHKVIVPNIPLLTAVSAVEKFEWYQKREFLRILNELEEKAFKTFAADRFIVGGDSRSYPFLKHLKMENQRKLEQFERRVNGGFQWLQSINPNGLRADVQTVNTGISDINKLGLINNVDGETRLKYWSTDECNTFNDATDGTFFSPEAIRNKKPVRFFIPEMCRTLPLEFNREIISNEKISAYRYTMPFSAYDSPDKTPSHQCFCDLDLFKCSLQGTFNAQPCFFGSPLYYSLPHFYNADPILSENILGLNASSNPEDYETYFDIHPTLGFALAGKIRFQVNIQVAQADPVEQVKMFKDGLILPVAIIEYSLGNRSFQNFS